MLLFRVFAKLHPRRSPNSFPALTPIPCPLLVLPAPSISGSVAEGSPKSHGLNVFADPHPLTPVASIFYKNIGGRGRRSDVQTFRRADVPYPPKSFSCTTYKKPGVGGSPDHYPLSRSLIFRTLFQVPYPVSPFLATLAKTAGCIPTIPILELAARHSTLATVLKSFLFTFLRTLLHARKTQLFCFQAIPHSLRKTTGGWGGAS